MAMYEITTKAGEIDFECSGDRVKRTVQNCKNLLLCRRGEVPYDRLRGLDPAIFDLPKRALEEALMQEVDRALMWEPDAEAVRAWTEVEDGETVIHSRSWLNIQPAI